MGQGADMAQIIPVFSSLCCCCLSLVFEILLRFVLLFFIKLLDLHTMFVVIMEKR